MDMEFSKGGLIGKTVTLARAVQKMRIGLHAASAGYFIALSVFPSLVLLLSLLRYTQLDARDLLEFLSGMVPEALMEAAEDLVISTYAYTSTTMVSISAVSALWSASRGIYGLLTGLNGVYGREERRSWLQTRLMSVVYTFLFMLVMILTLVLHVFGNTIGKWIAVSGDLRLIWWTNLVDLSFFALVATQTLLFAAMFMFLPEGRNGFRESLPGALVGSLGWMTFSSIFSVYVENFNRYTNIYGNLYAVVLGMLWLYMCVSILFYGGALNRFLAESR